MDNVLLTCFAPFGARSTLPLVHCYGRLQAAEIPIEPPYGSGARMCNEVRYAALRHASSHDPLCKAGFVHVPYAPPYIARRGHPAPGLPMSMLVEAPDLIVQEYMQ